MKDKCLAQMKPSKSGVWVSKCRCCSFSDTGVHRAKKYGATKTMTNLRSNSESKRSIAIPSKGYNKNIAIVLLVWQMSLSRCFFGRPFYRIFVNKFHFAFFEKFLFLGYNLPVFSFTQNSNNKTHLSCTLVSKPFITLTLLPGIF